MKKLINEVALLAVVISITCNSFTTFAAAPKDPGTSNQGSDNSVPQELSVEETQKLLQDRMSNPEKYRNAETQYISLKKNPLAEGISRAIEEGKEPKMEFEVKASTALTSSNYGTIRDKATGVTLILSKTPKTELDKVSPKNIGKYIDDSVIEGEFERVDEKKPFDHIKSFKDATRHAIVGFPIEAATFYAGVTANHLFNLMVSYEDNPMALEMFMEELKSPAGQVGFLAFMIGNRYAQSYFMSILEARGTPLMKRYMKPLLGFLAMGVGSLFSNISHDLMTLTKPCAVAMYNPQKEEYNTGEKRLEKCQEGWNAVMTSDNLARYVTTTMTVIAAAIGSTIVQSIYKGVAARTLPIDKIKIIFRTTGMIGKKALKAGKVVPGPVGFAIKILDLVIFLQADEFFHPQLHYLTETVMNSNPKLASAKALSDNLIGKLHRNKWQDVIQKTCKDAIAANAANRRDHVPQWILSDMRLCGNGHDAVAMLAEKNQKWRETLSYGFMNSYMNWVRYISEFQTMHDVSKDYFQKLINFAYSAKQAEKSFTYNPLTTDNPFYGVYVSDNFNLVNQENYNEVNQARAQRIVESLDIINKAIAEIKANEKKWNDYAKSNPKVYRAIETKKAPGVKRSALTSQYLKDLTEIKKTILAYKAKPDPSNYPGLVTSLKKINSLYQASQAPYLLTSSSVGPYATYVTDEQVISFGFEQNENGIRKKTIREIRNFLGEPKPLVKGEAFLEIFNAEVKATKGEYSSLFDEKATAADTITWFAVCGNTLKGESARVDKRRTPIGDWLDKGLNYLIGNHNAKSDWVAEKLNVNNLLHFELNPMRRVAKFFNYGTGVDFYTPKIVKHDLKEACENEISYSIRPNPTSPIAKKIKVDGKSYDSLFSYLVDNIKPEVLNEGTDAYGFKSANFDGWWDKVVTPKVSLAYDDFMKGYNELVQKKYRDAIDHGLSRGADKKGFNHLSEIFKGVGDFPEGHHLYQVGKHNYVQAGPSLYQVGKHGYNLMNARAFHGSAKSLIQSYYDEMNSYLKTLNTMYVLAPERQELLKTPAGTKRFADENKFVQARITNIRYTVYSMLNDFRNFDNDPIFIEGKVPSFKLAVDQASKISDKYALLLIELNGLNSVLGFNHGIISAAALKTTHFRQKEARKESFMMATPSQQLAIRVKNDYSINVPFYEYVNLGPKVTSQMLTYGIDDTNSKVKGYEKDGQTVITDVQLTPNFTANDRLTLAFNMSNQLFLMAEDLFKNISILNAAKIDNTYKHLDSGDSQKGQGSRPF